MNTTRRNFIGGLSALGAAGVLSGCRWLCPPGGAKPGLALQLYSVRDYIEKNGLARTFEEIARLGYRGVEFAGSYEKSAAELKKMLADNGLAVVGAHVSRQSFTNKNFEKNVEFELSYGNTLMICPGNGNCPVSFDSLKEQPVTLTDKQADYAKRIVGLYNRAAEICGKMGMKVGLHNHRWEHQLFFPDGTSYWDYFFANTDPRVQMEQDVGWSACAGIDPIAQYGKYPHRSVTLHAKENGGLHPVNFEGILGRCGDAVRKGVDWDGVIAAATQDGVKWFVVECEYHSDDFGAIGPSAEFLKGKGIV